MKVDRCNKRKWLNATKKARCRRYPAETMTDADHVDDIALLENTHDQVESLLHSVEKAAGDSGFYVNANRIENACLKREVVIFNLSGRPLKLVDKLYLGSNIN